MKKVVTGTFLLLFATLLFISCASSVSLEQFEAYQAASQERIDKLEQELAMVCSTQEHFVEKTELQRKVDEIGSALGSLESSFAAVQTDMSKFALHQDVSALERQVAAMTRDYDAAVLAFDELSRHAGYDGPVQLVQLGHKIIEVNRNIADIDAKIEQLRAVMALFAER